MLQPRVQTSDISNPAWQCPGCFGYARFLLSEQDLEGRFKLLGVLGGDRKSHVLVRDSMGTKHKPHLVDSKRYYCLFACCRFLSSTSDLLAMPTFEIHDEAWYKWILAGLFALALITYKVCAYITAPYGRHVKRGWGPTWGVRECWIVMESPALWAMVLFYSMGEQKLGRVPLILLRLHQLHYFNRVLIYPIRLKGIRGKSMPLIVAACGFAFNILNSYIQGRWLSNYGTYPDSWLTSPKFITGATMFFLGFVCNIWSDSVLLSLRTDEDDRSYRIPRGGLFRFVTCPNYFSEMIEWLGWAIMTWSPAGLAFFVYTVANLTPRAKSNHQWYLSKFSDYPKERKILVPYVY